MPICTNSVHRVAIPMSYRGDLYRWQCPICNDYVDDEFIARTRRFMQANDELLRRLADPSGEILTNINGRPSEN